MVYFQSDQWSEEHLSYLENLVFVRFKGMQFKLQISKVP